MGNSGLVLGVVVDVVGLIYGFVTLPSCLGPAVYQIINGVFRVNV